MSVRRKASKAAQELKNDNQLTDDQIADQLLDMIRNEGFDGDYKTIATRFPNMTNFSMRYFVENLRQGDHDPIASSFDPWIRTIRENSDVQR